MTTTDETITKTIYRRVYSAWLEGRRINRISQGAEILFLRLNLIADGFGIYKADPILILARAFPLRREVREEDVAAWHDELVEAGLVSTYEAGEELYGAIDAFEDVQPAGRNGKRYEEHPRRPGPQLADKPADNTPEASEGIPGNPGGSQNDQQVRAGEREREREREQEREEERERAPAPDPLDQIPADQDAPAPLGSVSLSGPDSCSGSPTDGTGSPGKDASPEPFTRAKARARWDALVLRQKMIGKDFGAWHPAGSRQHTADLTSLDRLFERVWPEELDDPADADQVQRYNHLVRLTKQAKGKKIPMAYLTSQIKNEIKELAPA